MDREKLGHCIHMASINSSIGKQILSTSELIVGLYRIVCTSFYSLSRSRSLHAWVVLFIQWILQRILIVPISHNDNTINVDSFILLFMTPSASYTPEELKINK